MSSNIEILYLFSIYIQNVIVTPMVLLKRLSALDLEGSVHVKVELVVETVNDVWQDSITSLPPDVNVSRDSHSMYMYIDLVCHPPNVRVNSKLTRKATKCTNHPSIHVCIISLVQNAPLSRALENLMILSLKAEVVRMRDHPLLLSPSLLWCYSSSWLRSSCLLSSWYDPPSFEKRCLKPAKVMMEQKL